MKKYIVVATTIAALVLSACSVREKDKYDVAGYYDLPRRDSLLVSIVTYIFEAPPYTPMKDRFQDKHRPFYSKASAQFSIDKYYIADDSTYYFYIIRPGGKPSEKRGAGGYFKMDKHFKLKDFHEVFVTPVLPEADVKGRCAFLFDEMVNHNIGKFLTMKTYVQWPNKVSYYDTITYEWKLIPEYMN